MRDRHQWPEWLRGFPAWVSSAVGLVTAVIGLVILIQGNVYLGVTVLGALVLFALLVLCTYVILAKTPPLIEGGGGVYRYEKARSWAFAVGGLVAILAAAVLIIRPSRSFVTIAVLGTPAPEPTMIPTSLPTALVEVTPLAIETAVPSSEAIATDIVEGIGQVSQVVEGDSRQAIIIIAEEHASRQGQVEAAIMLNRLYEDYDVRHIGQEGVFKADGMLDTSWYDPSLTPGQLLSPKERAVVQVLAEGEISSGEMLALVYPDFKLHGIERAAEYNIDLPYEATTTPIVYLWAIATTTASPDEVDTALQLVEKDRGEEGIEYLINSNPFTKERYVLLTDEASIISIEDMSRILEEIEAEAERTNAPISSEDRQGFALLKDFNVRALHRSDTMLANALELADQYPDAPIAIVIGAAHKERFAHLLIQEGVPFAVVTPHALSESASVPGYGFARTPDQSVDPPGTLGALLNGRHKPTTVVGRTWFRSKLETYFVTILIAFANSRDHPLLSTQISQAVSQLQYVVPVPDSFQRTGDQIIFAVQAQTEGLAQPTEIWIRTTTQEAVPDITLEMALLDTLASLHLAETIGVSELTQEPGNSVPVVHFTSDIKALFSPDQSLVMDTRLAD